MPNMIKSLRTAIRNHALFVRTRDEIASLPLNIALDLDIYPGDADKIARKVVWG